MVGRRRAPGRGRGLKLSQARSRVAGCSCCHGVTSSGASLGNLVCPFQNNVQDTSAAMEIAYRMGTREERIHIAHRRDLIISVTLSFYFSVND
jgi:hypothetical protein